MFNDVKILLTVVTEGGVLYESTEPQIREFIVRKKDLFPYGTKFKNNEGNQVIRKGKYKFYPYSQSTSTTQIKMCKEAYEYMTSTTCPEWFRDIKAWKKLKETARLELHLARTCEHLHGKSFTYSIIED